MTREWRDDNRPDLKGSSYNKTRPFRERPKHSGRPYRSRALEMLKAKRTTASNRRRARLRQVPGAHTTAEWLALCRAYNYCCAYCGKSCPLSLHREHVIPLSRPGSCNCIANIVPACPTCNGKKGAKLRSEGAPAPRPLSTFSE